MSLAAVAWADLAGPLRAAPMSPLTSALVFAGLTLLIGAIVVVVVVILTRRPGSRPDGKP